MKSTNNLLNAKKAFVNASPESENECKVFSYNITDWLFSKNEKNLNEALTLKINLLEQYNQHYSVLLAHLSKLVKIINNLRFFIKNIESRSLGKKSLNDKVNFYMVRRYLFKILDLSKKENEKVQETTTIIEMLRHSLKNLFHQNENSKINEMKECQLYFENLYTSDQLYYTDFCKMCVNSQLIENSMPIIGELISSLDKFMSKFLPNNSQSSIQTSKAFVAIKDLMVQMTSESFTINNIIKKNTPLSLNLLSY